MDDDETGGACVHCCVEGYRVDTPKIETIANRICQVLGVSDYELSIKLTSSEEIHQLNKKYREVDSTTDVLSFPQNEWELPLTVNSSKTESGVESSPIRTLGDIVISVMDAEKNAKKIGHGLDREIGFLLVHGILHLCGHDHKEKEDEEKMLTQQRKLMDLISEPTETPLWDRSVEVGRSV